MSEPKWKDAAMTLLAIVHRDGGHYVQDHGLHQAVKDAKTLILRDRDNDGKRMAELVAAVRAVLTLARAEVKRLREFIMDLATMECSDPMVDPAFPERTPDPCGQCATCKAQAWFGAEPKGGGA